MKGSIGVSKESGTIKETIFGSEDFCVQQCEKSPWCTWIEIMKPDVLSINAGGGLKNTCVLFKHAFKINPVPGDDDYLKLTIIDLS